MLNKIYATQEWATYSTYSTPKESMVMVFGTTWPPKPPKERVSFIENGHQAYVNEKKCFQEDFNKLFYGRPETQVIASEVKKLLSSAARRTGIKDPQSRKGVTNDIVQIICSFVPDFWIIQLPSLCEKQLMARQEKEWLENYRKEIDEMCLNKKLIQPMFGCSPVSLLDVESLLQSEVPKLDFHLLPVSISLAPTFLEKTTNTSDPS